MRLSIPAMLLGVAFSLPASAANPPSLKKASVMVTAEMRAHAIENTDRYDWARRRRNELQKRLKPYLEADDPWLRAQLPSQGMPRAWTLEATYHAPPEAEETHFQAASQPSRGFGRKNRYHIDPFGHPWKVQSRGSGRWYPDNDFAAYYASGLDEKGRFQLDRADRSLLKMPEGSLVDDGLGALSDGRRYFFAAHYALRIWMEWTDLTRDLAELYTLTNDPAAARKAALILDRMADLYPEMDFMPWHRHGMEAATGGSGEGRVQGRIWETFLAQRLSLAYDQIFDALIADPAIPAFFEGAAGKQTGREIAAHIEENLLREFVRGIRDGRLHGNPGMRQYAMAAAAVALDSGEETRALLDWIYDPQGGNLPGILTDGLSRDGYGLEGGLGYATLPTRSFFGVAQLLANYPGSGRRSPFKDFPKLANALAAGERVRIAGGSILHWGDGGAAMRVAENGYPMPMEMAQLGFRLDGRPENLRELYLAAGRKPESIPGDIYAREPETERQRMIKALGKFADDGLPPQPSFNSGGIGFAVLNARTREPYTVALNYGPMGWGHGHADRLGLHLVSHGAYMATDLGYPTMTGPFPQRLGWSSHTVSHNTVMVDDVSMEKTSSFSGKSELFAEAGPVHVMDIEAAGEQVLRGLGHSKNSSEARPIYPGVETYRRCVVTIDVDETRAYTVDLFWVRGGSIHRLIQNGGGTTVTSDAVTWQKQAKGTVAGEEIPYEKFYDGPANWDYNGSGLMFLKNVERARPQAPFSVDWQIAPPYNQKRDLHFRVHNLGTVGEALLADGESPSRGPTLRYLHRVVRGKDLRTQFVSILEPYEGEPFIRSCRLLGTGDFAAALEITLADGRKDTLLVTENGGSFVVRDGLALKGRLGWQRTGADGKVAASVLINASRLDADGHTTTQKVASFKGKIAAIEDGNPEDIIIVTDANDLPETVIGRYLIVRNGQRADASYRIEAIRNGNRLHLGRAALDEIHRDPDDFSKGCHQNIAVGDAFMIPNTHVSRP